MTSGPIRMWAGVGAAGSPPGGAERSWGLMK